MLLSPADRYLTLFLLLPRWAEREEYLNSSLYLHSSGSLGTSRSAFRFIWLLDLRQIAWRLPQSATHRRVQIVRKLGLTLLAVFMLGITGCHKSIGPKTIPRDRKRTFSSHALSLHARRHRRRAETANHYDSRAMNQECMVAARGVRQSHIRSIKTDSLYPWIDASSLSLQLSRLYTGA